MKNKKSDFGKKAAKITFKCVFQTTDKVIGAKITTEVTYFQDFRISGIKPEEL